ncbi:hypothetical protein [Mycolicibacterium komossense]|uniref:Uncharacterized protein n=1 Tax=Mycolicibacterium komossense TaxID=1779 RepID=A0ABT3C767_9MYCO|nr:hypothetical protein [Mycolicibacterium komossense]MCV7225270.1 hypothetical protein [Mycolicibacterium komossense]
MSTAGGELGQLGGHGIAEVLVGIDVNRATAVGAVALCLARCASNSREYSSKVNLFCWKAYSMSSEVPRS